MGKTGGRKGKKRSAAKKKYSRVMLIPVDPEENKRLVEERPKPFNRVRCEENLFELRSNAFQKYTFKEYVPDDPEHDRPFPDPAVEAKYQLFIKEYMESEGFDVEHYCDEAASLMHLPLDDDSNIVYMEYKQAVEAAIRCVNHLRNSNLVLEKIIKCNYIDGTHYFATFEVRGNNGVKSTYQAEVQRNHLTGKTIIHKFRPQSDYPRAGA